MGSKTTKWCDWCGTIGTVFEEWTSGLRSSVHSNEEGFTVSLCEYCYRKAKELHSKIRTYRDSGPKAE